MMGSKEEDVPTEPLEKPLFVEDMNEGELASAVSKCGVGFTCGPNLIFFRCSLDCKMSW
jgi:ubiquitin carboxyl-terminal hydrolase 14